MAPRLPIPFPIKINGEIINPRMSPIVEKTISNYYRGALMDAKTQDAYVMKCKLNQTGTSNF